MTFDFQAVCCSDKTHCCPWGTSCDVSSGICLRGPESDLNWLLKELAGSARSNVGYTAMRPHTRAHEVSIFRQPYARVRN